LEPIIAAITRNRNPVTCNIKARKTRPKVANMELPPDSNPETRFLPLFDVSILKAVPSPAPADAIEAVVLSLAKGSATA
jgi:hypothetical protein